MKKIILTAVATVAEKSAKKADGTISILGLHEQEGMSMKRIIIGIFFCLVFLTGCNRSDKYNIPEETNSSEDNSINKTFSNYVYDNDRAQLQSFNRLAISQNGYYYTANHTLF